MQLVPIKVVAEFLMVKQSTVYSWVHNGSIPFHRLNRLIRFDMDEIKTWVETSKQLMQSSARQSHKRTSRQDIDAILRKAIDSSKNKSYNASNGKPGQHRGLRKEG